MRKQLLMFLFLVTATSVFAQIPNNSFEDWTPVTTLRVDPVGWKTWNAIYPSSSTVKIQGNTGAFCARIRSIWAGGLNFIGGTVQMDSASYAGARPTSFNCIWRTYNYSGLDGVDFKIYCFNSNMDTIGRASYVTLPYFNQAAWANLSLPITYTSSANVSFYTIHVTWVNHSGDDYSYCEVDEFSFGTVAAIVPIPTPENVSLARMNDQLYQLTIKNDHLEINAISIFDITGKLVHTLYTGHGVPSSEQFDIPTDDLNTGIYFCRIEGPNIQQSLRFVKE